MKTLVTHINPHLDDICAIWLFRRFHPDFKDAKLEFVSASRDLAQKEEGEEKIFVGTGGGKFDEHKEGLKDECAASLVFKFLKEKEFLPEEELSIKALEELVEWNRLIDTGKAPDSQFSEVSIQSFIRSKDNSTESSTGSVILGEEVLDRVFKLLKAKQQSIKDWENRIEFESSFGKSIAVKSSTIDRPFCKAQGGDLFLIYDPNNKSVQFFTPSFEIDLEPLYKKLTELDPKASWFLHQSHHMILCGAGAAPEFTPTKLSFEELIDILKNI